MTDDDGSQSNDRPSGAGRAHTADTVPPPAGGDVYDAPTEIRQAPEDLLDIMRGVKEARAAKGAGTGITRIPPAAGVPSVAALVMEVPAPAPPASPPPLAVAAVDPPRASPELARPPRARTTAVAVLTILLVVTVVLVALSLAITLRGGAPAT